MKSRRIALAVVCGAALFISPAQAQVGTFPGVDIFTRGAGDIGTRSGNAVDLRFFAGVSAIYDSGIQPVSLDSAGHLTTADGLYGTEVNVGAYGQHQYKHARLGLDYRGTFRHYSSSSFFDGSDHQFSLGYSIQKSTRMSFDFRQIAGSASQGASFAGGLPTSFSTVVDPTTLLFDNRTYYLQSVASVNYILSPRTTFTAGGNWSTVQRQSSALVGVKSYGLNGSIEHRPSLTTAYGVTYQHTHYDFSQGFGESDINLFQGFWSRTLGRYWSFTLRGGVYQSEVIGLQQIALNPVLAQLFGVPFIVQGFYRANVLPNAQASLSRTFKHAWFNMDYQRSISPGNGVYLTSRQELGSATYAYTGIRKWTFNVIGSYGRLNSIGQSFNNYTQFSGGTGATYAITRALYATAHFDERHYDIAENIFNRTAYRVTFGLSFSPADIPLSFR